MKTIKKVMKLSGYLFLLSLFIMSCSAEDGNDGAVGPEGPQGEQGEQGPQGEQGETGSANVIYSAWIESGFEADIPGSIATFSIDAPPMTDEIINQGVILVYGRVSALGDQDVLPLPITIATINETYYFRAEEAGELQIRVQSLDGGLIGSTLFSEYRYVLIPGEQPASSGKNSESKNYTKMTYQEIQELFDISD